MPRTLSTGNLLRGEAACLTHPATWAGARAAACAWPWGSLGPQMGRLVALPVHEAGLWAVTSSKHQGDGLPRESTGVQGQSPGSQQQPSPASQMTLYSGAGLRVPSGLSTDSYHLAPQLHDRFNQPLPSLEPLLPEVLMPADSGAAKTSRDQRHRCLGLATCKGAAVFCPFTREDLDPRWFWAVGLCSRDPSVTEPPPARSPQGLTWCPRPSRQSPGAHSNSPRGLSGVPE